MIPLKSYFPKTRELKHDLGCLPEQNDNARDALPLIGSPGSLHWSGDPDLALVEWIPYELSRESKWKFL